MLELLLNKTLIFGLIGGLGLFLFGMKIMSEGLQKIAGNRIRMILAALTNNRVVGMLVGLSVTAIVQSSSATTVMVVGFVNAGLMSLVQAIGVVLGANIGTTFTAQLIAFKITKYALPAIGIGAGLKLFARSRKWVYIGEILLGFGILFFGLSIMKDAFDPIKGSEAFKAVFLTVGSNHLLGVLIGALMTIIVQSSSATIGITLALATSGLLSFEASVALILGENIGTTITANLAAIGTNLAARRTALAHFLFNAIGTIYLLFMFPYYMDFISYITAPLVGGAADFIIQTQEQAALLGASIGDKPFIARHIANTHTMFNVINVLVFLPFVGLLARVATMIIPGTDETVDFRLKYLDNRVLNTPPIALGQARAETRRMAQVALKNFHRTIQFLKNGDLKKIQKLKDREELIDIMQREITDFLVALSQKSISQETSREIAALMHMVNDLERIGDYCENLWRLSQKKIEAKIIFSETAISELEEISTHTSDFLKYVFNGMDDKIPLDYLKKSIEMEERIDAMEKALRDNHINRLNTGECAVLPGLIFIDMLHNFEKIGDHTYNLAEAVIGVK